MGILLDPALIETDIKSLDSSKWNSYRKHWTLLLFQTRM